MLKFLIQRSNSAFISLIIAATILLTSFAYLPEALAVIQEQYIYGDVSGDGTVDSSDYTLLRRYLLGIAEVMPAKAWNMVADLNKDNNIDSADYSILRKYLLGNITSLPYQPVVDLTPTFTPTLTPTNVTFTPDVNDVQMSITGTLDDAVLEISITLPDNSYSVADWGNIENVEYPINSYNDFSKLYFCHAQILKRNIPDTQIIKTPKIEKKSYNIKQCFSYFSHFIFNINGNELKKIYILRESKESTPIIYPYDIELFTPSIDDVKVNKMNTTSGADIEVEITLPDNSYSTIFNDIMQIIPYPDSPDVVYYQEAFLGSALVFKSIMPESEIIKIPKTEKFIYKLRCSSSITNYFSFDINRNDMKELYFTGGLIPTDTPIPTSVETSN